MTEQAHNTASESREHIVRQLIDVALVEFGFCNIQPDVDVLDHIDSMKRFTVNKKQDAILTVLRFFTEVMRAQHGLGECPACGAEISTPPRNNEIFRCPECNVDLVREVTIAAH
jgi:predicted RNA-binding Zn-ribbon protein involved in translation (DUF1610 family)